MLRYWSYLSNQQLLVIVLMSEYAIKRLLPSFKVLDAMVVNLNSFFYDAKLPVI